MSWSGLPEKLEKYIMPEPNSGCWIWLGGLRDSKDGYGGIKWENKIWRSHRLIYTLLRNAVGATLDIDHLCRNRICCNPDHLEPCPRKINIHRGQGVAAKNRLKTHCANGHEYSVENTYVWSDQRFCKLCHRAYTKNTKDQRQILNELLDPNEEFYGLS